MAQESSNRPFRYALGHERDELDRLISLGWFMGDLTEHVLRLAGIASGMRVLDAGCGAGEVAFLAARLVGPGARSSGWTSPRRPSRWRASAQLWLASRTSTFWRTI